MIYILLQLHIRFHYLISKTNISILKAPYKPILYRGWNAVVKSSGKSFIYCRMGVRHK